MTKDFMLQSFLIFCLGDRKVDLDEVAVTSLVRYAQNWLMELQRTVVHSVLLCFCVFHTCFYIHWRFEFQIRDSTCIDQSSLDVAIH